MTKIMTFSITPELFEELCVYCQTTRNTKSLVIRQAIEQYINEPKENVTQQEIDSSVYSTE